MNKDSKDKATAMKTMDVISVACLVTGVLVVSAVMLGALVPLAYIMAGVFLLSGVAGVCDYLQRVGMMRDTLLGVASENGKNRTLSRLQRP